MHIFRHVFWSPSLSPSRVLVTFSTCWLTWPWCSRVQASTLAQFSQTHTQRVGDKWEFIFCLWFLSRFPQTEGRVLAAFKVTFPQAVSHLGFFISPLPHAFMPRRERKFQPCQFAMLAPPLEVTYIQLTRYHSFWGKKCSSSPPTLGQAIGFLLGLTDTVHDNHQACPAWQRPEDTG